MGVLAKNKTPSHTPTYDMVMKTSSGKVKSVPPPQHGTSENFGRKMRKLPYFQQSRETARLECSSTDLCHRCSSPSSYKKKSTGSLMRCKVVDSVRLSPELPKWGVTEQGWKRIGKITFSNWRNWMLPSLIDNSGCGWENWGINHRRIGEYTINDTPIWAEDQHSAMLMSSSDSHFWRTAGTEDPFFCHLTMQ